MNVENPIERPGPEYVAQIVVALRQAGAVKVMGLVAVWLVIVIASAEAEAQCRQVKFFDGELQKAIGAGSYATFRRALRAAVAAGWLLHVPGRKGRPGVYSTAMRISREVCELDAAQHGSRLPESSSKNAQSNLTEKNGGETKSLFPEAGGEPDQQVAASPKRPSKNSVANAEITARAEELYNLYPKKVSKAAAIKAILKALQKTPFEELEAAVKEYAAAVAGEDRKFIPHPATWFNAERWKDDRSEWSAQRRALSKSERLGQTYIPSERKDPRHGFA